MALMAKRSRLPPPRTADDYASGGAPGTEIANTEPGSPLRGKTEGDVGKYGLGENPPNKAPQRPDRKFREVAGAGSAGSFQKRSKRLKGS
jgi:hypothetical protein